MLALESGFGGELETYRLALETGLGGGELGAYILSHNSSDSELEV